MHQVFPLTSSQIAYSVKVCLRIYSKSHRMRTCSFSFPRDWDPLRSFRPVDRIVPLPQFMLWLFLERYFLCLSCILRRRYFLVIYFTPLHSNAFEVVQTKTPSKANAKVQNKVIFNWQCDYGCSCGCYRRQKTNPFCINRSLINVVCLVVEHR